MVKKAFAYVTRRLDGTKQLLVFCSPSQHVEVPKGTVEAGEDLTLAVLRELREESGIATVRVIHKIGERTTWVHGGPEMNGPMEEQRHYAYELEAGCPVLETWDHTVSCVGIEDGLVFRYEWRDLTIGP